MDSVVSREKVVNVIKKIERMDGFKTFSAYSECWDALNDLPDEEVRKIVYAQWKVAKNSIYCSNCGTFINKTQYNDFKNNFCPFCGATMFRHRKVKR